MKRFLFFLMVLLPIYSISQNIVKNGSFEETIECANDLQKFDKNVKHWSTPTSGSTDLFNKCTTYKDVSANDNYQGKQLPYDGDNYVGCYFLGIDDYREYIQGTLSDSLIQGTKYRISFKISLADKSDMAIKNIAVMFTDTIVKLWRSSVIDSYEEKRLLKKNSFFKVDLSQENYLDDKEKWVEIDTVFIAQKPALYFSIGNFNSNKATQKKKQKFIPKIRKAYYYIDDVSIIALEEATIETKMVLQIPKKEIIIDSVEFKEKDTIQTVKYIEENDTIPDILFQPIYFGFDKSTLTTSSIIKLNSIAEYLFSNTKYKIIVSGHTDNKGNHEYNQKLSIERAKKAVQYLINHGIDVSRVNYKAFGETQPTNANLNEDERSRNRRVEFLITD